MKTVYFIGIGGIGMSAIARAFKQEGLAVAGYDLTPSPLTQALEREGIAIHYEDDINLIDAPFRSKETLIVYTPAIPRNHQELNYFIKQGNKIQKRAEVLGTLTRDKKSLCVAGTHGKTTTSTLLAHLLYDTEVGCNAILGGIANNYGSNLLVTEDCPNYVLEADEFDRSFHHLRPYMAVITSSDPDHLDIYGTAEAYRESFEHFTSLISPDGCLLLHNSVELDCRTPQGTKVYRYSSTSEADFYASDIVINDARLYFIWHYRQSNGEMVRQTVELGVPLLINVDNAVAALSIAYLNGLDVEMLTERLKTFRGVQRRFDRHITEGECLLIDDYAHHPTELTAAISSVRFLYPTRHIVGVFQPHLFSRTHDFHREFAKALSLLDEAILLPIYPARELPIKGVNSELIAQDITIPHQIVEKDELINFFAQRDDRNTVIVTLGAGNIGLLPQPLAEMINKKYNN